MTDEEYQESLKFIREYEMDEGSDMVWMVAGSRRVTPMQVMKDAWAPADPPSELLVSE